MKPWDEYTAEGDAKLYEDSFDVTTAPALDSEETNNLRVQLQDMEAATLKVREKLLQQKSIITELQEKLTKEEEEKQALHSLVDQLRLEVTTENRLRQAAEDGRGMNLFSLKLEMATQEIAAKDREEKLQKELAKVKSQLEKEQQTFENVIKESKAAYETVVREKQHISVLNYNFAKLSQLQNMDKAEHEKERWHLLDKMAQLRSSHQSELDRHAKEHVELQTALEKAQEELQRYCDWEKEKASLIQTSEELKKMLQEQEQHKLLMQDKEKEHQLILHNKEKEHNMDKAEHEKEKWHLLDKMARLRSSHQSELDRHAKEHVQLQTALEKAQEELQRYCDWEKEKASLIQLFEELKKMLQEQEQHKLLQDKEKEHRLILQNKEKEHRLLLQDKEEEHQLILQDKEEELQLMLQNKEEELRLMLQNKEEELQLMLQNKEEDQQLILQKITELEKRMQKKIKRKWYQRLFNHSS